MTLFGFLSMVVGVVLVAGIAGFALSRSRSTPSSHEFGEDSIMTQATSERICPETGCAVEQGGPLPGCVGTDGTCAHRAAQGLQVPCVREDCPKPQPHAKATRLAA